MSQGSTGSAGFKIQGNVAQGGSDAGNPVKIGYFAGTSLPPAVANGQDVNALGDPFGRQVVLINGFRNLVTQNTITLSNTTETTLLTAVASTFLDISSLIITNTSSSAVRVDLRDATAGTIRIPIWINANSGAVINPVVPYTQTTLNSNWTAQLSSSVTDVRLFVQAISNK